MEGILHSDRLNLDFNGGIVHCGLQDSPFDTIKPNFMDKWQVTICVAGRNPQFFEFHTGIGHRKLLEKNMRQYDQWRHAVEIDILRQGEWHDRVKQKAAIEHDSRPVPPKLDDVLYSLVTDSEAGQTTFADWCANFGYDEDSRKALATYEACQQNADKLRKAGVTDLEKAREAFQDY